MNMQHNDQNKVEESDKYQIRISDLPREAKTIAKLIGLKSTLKLVVEYSGESIYIPKYDTITRTIRDRAIRAEFNGINQKELSRKFNITSRAIRIIIKGAQKT